MTSNLTFLALIPGILIIIYIYRKDTVEKEPWPLILKLLIFGAISCIPAIFWEGAMELFVPSSPKLLNSIGEAFIVAALCEESCKFGLLWLGSWRNKNFDYRFDGIVYGVTVAVGFALLENLMYVADGGLETALVRAVLAVPLHAFCGAFMGMFYGAMMKNHVQGNSGGVFRCLIGALLVPMAIHGIYDTLAFMGDLTSEIILLAFVAALYIVGIRIVNKFSREDWHACFYGEPHHEAQQQNQNYYGQNQYGGAQNRQNPFGGGQFHQSMDDFKLYHGPQQSAQTAGKVVLVCPRCGGSMRVPAGVGRIKVSCPYCRNQFFDIT